MMRHMTIGKKLTVSFSLVLAIGGLIAATSLWTINGLNTRFDTVVSKTARTLQLGSELNQLKSDLYVGQRGLVLAALINDKPRIAREGIGFNSTATKIRQKLDEIRPLVSLLEGRRLLGEFESDLHAWMEAYPVVENLCVTGHPEEAQAHSFQFVSPVYKKMTATGDQFVDIYRNILESDKRAAHEAYGRALWLSLLGIGTLAVLGVVVLYVVRGMSAILRQAASELNEGANQVARAAAQVAVASQSLAQGSSEQAASLEETSASGEQINSMARTNTGNSKMAADLVTKTQEAFIQTNDALDQTMTAMGEINAQSGKISKIIKVIDEIAFQTNILALNAAVEAARAGEAGMGFAVVAEEVRNLAQRSAQAAKDTAELIEESILKANDGKAKVDHVALAMGTITDESKKIKMLVDGVRVASEEQSGAIDQISKAITQMQQVTQATAASAEESASASEELNAQSRALKGVVDSLTLMVGAS